MLVNTIPFHSIIPFFSSIFFFFENRLCHWTDAGFTGKGSSRHALQEKVQALPSRFLQSYWREEYSARRRKRKYLTGLECMIISLYARGEADLWRRGGRAVLLINCGKWGHYVDSLKVKANRFPFKNTFGEFPGGPVVRTPCFHCWAWAVSLLGEIRSHTSYSATKDNNKTTDVAAVFSLK